MVDCIFLVIYSDALVYHAMDGVAAVYLMKKN